MAVVRLIRSLLNSEAARAAGRGAGQKAVGGRLAAPGPAAGGNWRELGKGVRDAGQGQGVSLHPSPDSGRPQTSTFQDVFF